MRLESLELINIRSYQQETIRFSKGITLLAGDIGSGKSSILYAIEFALFGARRGDLSAESLLRHGEDTGSVTLTFRLSEQEITITRSLKRAASSVRQEPGTLTIAGQAEELTALELRARVLELLGYPHQLLTKAKDVLFRYTVYTPQEEMKRILTDSSSHRLDVLRAVFGIDSYKLIQENLSSFTKDLRDKKRYLQGQISDLDELLDELKSLRAQQLSFDKQLVELTNKQEQAKNSLDAHKQSHQELEKQQQAYQQAKNQQLKAQAKQESLSEQLVRVTTEKQRLKEQLQEEIPVVDDPAKIRERLDELTQKNTSAKASAQASIASLQKQITTLQDEAQAITSLTNCPTCQQDVSSKHKTHIKEHANKHIKELSTQQAHHKKHLVQARDNLEKLSEKKSLLTKKQLRYDSYKQELHKQSLANKRLQELNTQITTLNKELVALKESSITLPDFSQEAFTKSKQQLEALQEAYTKARISYEQLTSKQEAITKQASGLQEKIVSRRAQQQRLEIITNQEDWLSSVFSESVADIEQELFSHIHKEFQAKFMGFVHTLLEEAGIHATLDVTFSPQITQDGYDADISTLSGGERQSISLAYRLALNETITSLVQGLNTTGLLVLDEPTDGFSSQQLVRVKQVLSDMSFHQLLLVSHEPHMQSVAETIVSVHKNASVSRIEE